jgi:hypothetical protein
VGRALYLVSLVVLGACSYTPATGNLGEPADADVLVIPDADPDRPDARQPPDARPPDARPPDAPPGVPDAPPPPDAPMATCPGYVTVAGAFPIGATYRADKNGDAWQDARADCQSDGGELVEIDNETEAAAVADLLQDEESPFFWVGAFDPIGGGDNNFTSVHGGPPPYQPWAGNEPDGGSQDCVLLGDQGAPHEFYDYLCGAPQFYVCECLPE